MSVTIDRLLDVSCSAERLDPEHLAVATSMISIPTVQARISAEI